MTCADRCAAPSPAHWARWGAAPGGDSGHASSCGTRWGEAAARRIIGVARSGLVRAAARPPGLLLRGLTLLQRGNTLRLCLKTFGILPQNRQRSMTLPLAAIEDIESITKATFNVQDPETGIYEETMKCPVNIVVAIMFNYLAVKD